MMAGDCRALKQKLTDLCAAAGRSDSLVRIACQELEAWYFGEPAAMAKAFGKDQLVRANNKSRFRVPDAIQHPFKELTKLIPEFQKISGARQMARHLTREGNCSRSFQVMLDGIERLCRG